MHTTIQPWVSCGLQMLCIWVISTYVSFLLAIGHIKQDAAAYSKVLTCPNVYLCSFFFNQSYLDIVRFSSRPLERSVSITFVSLFVSRTLLQAKQTLYMLSVTKQPHQCFALILCVCVCMYVCAFVGFTLFPSFELLYISRWGFMLFYIDRNTA